MLREFVFEPRGRTKIWLDRHFARPEFLDLLADCDGLLARPDCLIVKDQKKITVGRLSLTVAGRCHHLYIKRYNVFSLRHRLGSWMVPSGAVKAMRGAAVLQKNAVRTARPVAAVENRATGALAKSFFVTEEIAGGKTADAFWLQDVAASPPRERCRRRKNFLAALGTLFRTLHGAAVYHNDLKDANILTVSEPDGWSQKFYLLDLEGVRQLKRLSARRRIKNLVQINRTLGRHLRRPEKLYFLKHYLQADFNEESATRKLIRRVLRKSARVDAAKGWKMPIPVRAGCSRLD